ncbi:MAG: hybrid sensor histidine kinase/response regulator [Caldilineaceae bacterium]|nr:hybrid sensor histidine kinase/response regulator [Caldilineaceae bacterium]MCB0142847.1 hybrid sensor histidine kinase/response regulator [Caldilineaceae bacterium]
MINSTQHESRNTQPTRTAPTLPAPLRGPGADDLVLQHEDVARPVLAKPTNSDDQLFLSEDLSDAHGLSEQHEPWKIMLVDDEDEVHQVTQLALRRVRFQNRRLSFISAYSAAEAMQLMQEHPDTAVILLDVVMETNHAGLDFVKHVREVIGNKRVRIILRTGQPGLAPEESVIIDYDINDYKTKTELTRTRLFTTVVAALRTYNHVTTIEANKRELGLLYEGLKSANIELERAKNEAEQANKAKSAFLSNMGHELRTPLAVIQSKSDVFRRGIYGPVTERQAQALQIIRSNGRTLLTMINDLFDMSKIEAGELELAYTLVPLKSLCQASIAETLAFVEEPKPHISLNIDEALDESLSIYTDEQRLRQVLVHLVHNTIKFSPADSESGLIVTQDAHRQHLIFTIWDQGIGIAQEDYKRIFEPFVQLDTSLTRSHAGAGLGLSLVKQLLELLDGSIRVESMIGQGSRFIVTLPNHPHWESPGGSQ